MDLVVEVVARSASAPGPAGSLPWISEIIDYAVEDHAAVIQLVLRHLPVPGGSTDLTGCEPDEVLHGLWSVVTEQVDSDVTPRWCGKWRWAGMHRHAPLFFAKT
jgi:hypothetical protein